MMKIRPATTADRAAIERLLTGAELTTHELPEWIDRLWIAEHEGAAVGVAGIELYADG